MSERHLLEVQDKEVRNNCFALVNRFSTDEQAAL